MSAIISIYLIMIYILIIYPCREFFVFGCYDVQCVIICDAKRIKGVQQNFMWWFGQIRSIVFVILANQLHMKVTGGRPLTKVKNHSRQAQFCLCMVSSYVDFELWDVQLFFKIMQNAICNKTRVARPFHFLKKVFSKICK